MTTAWSQLSAKEFQESGLLYYVNSTVLWPLGVALYVTKGKESGDYEDGIGLMMLPDPAENIVDGVPEEDDHPRYRASDWIARRLSQMPEAEAATARELLRDPMNVAAFLTDDPDSNRLARPDIP